MMDDKTYKPRFWKTSEVRWLKDNAAGKSLAELSAHLERSEVETDKYYKFDGEINDGEYLPPMIEFDEQEIGNEFLGQTVLPHEFAHLVEQGKVTMWDLEGALGWELDDAEINIIAK